ncbi:MAG: hypothetical protein FIA95_05650 [Gemmatimonadetes bacterium]|nr:hypothetical protein [Gemmatimonadota bacterium]
MVSALTLIACLALPQTGGALPDTVSTGALFAPSAASVALTAPLTLAPVPPLAGLPEGMADRDQEKPAIVEYSDAYFTRLTIHRWASYLTVPLFAAQYVVGQKLINGEGSDNLRGVHGALASSIAGLFVVNTVTGGWNALEARKDPEGKNRRTLHTALMLLADAGFVATGAMAKENEDEGGFRSGPVNNNAHRNMALASMGTALVSYAIMLPIFGRN